MVRTEGRSALICDAKAAVLRLDQAALDQKPVRRLIVSEQVSRRSFRAIARLGAKASDQKIAVEIIDQRLAVHGKRLPGLGQHPRPSRNALRRLRQIVLGQFGQAARHTRLADAGQRRQHAMLACGASLIAMISAISASARSTRRSSASGGGRLVMGLGKQSARPVTLGDRIGDARRRDPANSPLVRHPDHGDAIGAGEGRWFVSQ